MSTIAPWIESTAIEREPTTIDVKRFFGVPPDTDDRIDRNIARKRRHWKGKVRTQVASEEAHRKVEAAVRIIDALEQQLKRGMVDQSLELEQWREQTATERDLYVGELHDLWRVLEELVAAGRLDDALRVGRDARVRFNHAPQTEAAFGWLAFLASRGQEMPIDTLRREGIAALDAALAAGIADYDTYTWKAVLLLDCGDGAGALATIEEADRAVTAPLTPWLLSHRCEARALVGDHEAAADDALLAVRAAGHDLALRSNTVSALIVAIREALLPIDSVKTLRAYEELVELAAWCAIGAPEAEDRVRPYRLWAVQAAGRAYIGSMPLRSLVAVWTAFVLLPVLNRVRSKPQWKIYLDGPQQGNQEMFAFVAHSGFARLVHEGVRHKLSWRLEDVPVVEV